MAQLGVLRRWLGLGLAAALTPVGLAGQTAAPAAPPTRQTVVAGAHYRAGWLHRLFLGAHYRDLWGTPVEVEVLDLSRFAGGLTPTGCGGRRQTKVLRLLGKDGRQYVFRSIEKDPTLALPPELRATFARDLVQDQISSAHPGGPLVVAPLLDATGVLHAEPRIMLLPADDPRLRGYDCVRPGFLLGMIEERPTEPPDNEVAFAGAVELASTKKLFEHLEHSPRHRVDSRAYLAARLMDVFIGDWDRHHDQWRWARFDSGQVHIWRPIPRDRDQAFARLDGFLVWLTGFYWPQVVGFGDDYPSIWRLTLAGEVPDRRLLQDLEKPVWDSVARSLQARLTDSVIDGAVRRLPPEYLQKNGAALTRALRRRRDHLPQISDRYYALLAQVVEIHGTDERDLAEVERLAGGRASVRLSPGSGGPPFYRRTFDGRETQEIRIFLHGGDDRLIVRGTGGSGPLLRVIGGGGDDELTDSSRVGGTQFYDDRGNDRFVTGPGTSVDRRHYDEPPRDTSTFSLPRDWGSRWMPLTWVSYSPDLGVFAGAGADGTGYDFRRLPYNSHVRVRAGYATAAQTYRAEFTGEFRGVVPPVIVRVRLPAAAVQLPCESAGGVCDGCPDLPRRIHGRVPRRRASRHREAPLARFGDRRTAVLRPRQRNPRHGGEQLLQGEAAAIPRRARPAVSPLAVRGPLGRACAQVHPYQPAQRREPLRRRRRGPGRCRGGLTRRHAGSAARRAPGDHLRFRWELLPQSAGPHVAVRRGPCRGELVPHGPHPAAADARRARRRKESLGDLPLL